jgi:ABC-type sugar transport system substrate-binding protein
MGLRRGGTKLRAGRLAAAAIGVALMAVAATGCGSDDSSTSKAADGSAGKRVIKVAYSLDNLDATEKSIVDATEARVAALNRSRSDIHIEFSLYVASANVDKQISDIKTAVLKKPDVLIVSPVDSVGVLPAVQAARSAGVKVIDRRPGTKVEPLYDLRFFANDEPRYAAATVEWIKGWLDEHPGKVLHTGLIYGEPAQTAQLLREDAIKNLAKEMPDRIKIVATAYGKWLTATSQNITEDWLQAHPDINWIAAANDIMATGVSNAVVGAGKKSQILISGYDATIGGAKRIVKGTQDFSVGCPVAAYGKVVDAAVDLELGKVKGKKDYVVPQLDAVTKANAAQLLERGGLSQ